MTIYFCFFFDRHWRAAMPPLLLYLLLKHFLLFQCSVFCESFTISPFLLLNSSFQIPIYSIFISNHNPIPPGHQLPNSNLITISGQKSQCGLKGHWVSNVSLLFGSCSFY